MNWKSGEEAGKRRGRGGGEVGERREQRFQSKVVSC